MGSDGFVYVLIEHDETGSLLRWCLPRRAARMRYGSKRFDINLLGMEKNRLPVPGKRWRNADH